ncbi:ring finger domain containing protein [Nitzschia inconspicua]|uniref:Ring finger domain containing protein n=1 Tax=Nitzschia inconspicua TaxID=303405 RepID=A0A9K3PEK2_9STRA|nr:ring finger domain containing protein [Nitzschia inconspicua]
MNVVVLRRDPGSERMSFVKRLGLNADISSIENQYRERGQVRQLTSEDSLLFMGNYPIYDSIFGYSRLGGGIVTRGLMVDETETVVVNETDISSDADYFYARECRCFAPQAPVVYCPLAIDTCLRSTRALPPGCRNLSKGASFGWSMQMFLASWFLALLLCLLQRKGTGANVRDCLLHLCIPRYRERLADRILRNNPERARELYRSRYLHQQAEMYPRRPWFVSVFGHGVVLRQQQEMQRLEQESEGASPEIGNNVPAEADTSSVEPTALILRTRTYLSDPPKAATHSADDNDLSDCCAICFAELDNGDRVGVLEVCNHQFHVDCLKPWLQRRNACPLCQKDGIAKPHWEKDPKSTSSEVTSSGSVGSSTNNMEISSRADQGSANEQDS